MSTPQGVRTAGAFVTREGETVFQKKGDARKHMLRYPCEAWALDRTALEEVARRGVARVFVEDSTFGTWWARLSDFEEHGVPIDRGYGEQVALGVNWWSFLPSRQPVQPDLFQEVTHG